jgi:DNA-binding MarR family transcriptional regulator
MDALHLVEVFARLRSLHADFSLNSAMMLFTIASDPGISQRRLYEKLALHNSAASRALAILSDAGTREVPPLGLVCIEVQPDDQRQRILTLTSKGEKFVAGVLRELNG